MTVAVMPFSLSKSRTIQKQGRSIDKTLGQLNARAFIALL